MSAHSEYTRKATLWRVRPSNRSMPEPRSVDALLPLKPLVFQILLTLAGGERHGYGIVQDIARRRAARLQLRPGNLYRILDGALELGLIEEAEQRSPADD